MDMIAIDGFPPAKRKGAAIEYAQAWKAGADFADEVRASYEKYLSSQRKKLYGEFAERPELAECMMACCAIPPGEVWDVVAMLDGTGSDDLVTSLKEYRRSVDKRAKEEAAEKAAAKAKAKGASKAEAARAAKLEQETLLQERLKEAEPEVRENFPEGGVDDSVWAGVTEGVALADGSGTSSPYALMLLIHKMGVPRKSVETCRLGFSGRARVLERKKAAPIADAMDPGALSNALESLFFDKKVALALAPLCVFGGEGAVQRVVDRMPAWDDWYMGGANGRKDVNIATSALLQSDTLAAMRFFDKHKLLGEYASRRKTTEDAIRDNMLSDFGFDKRGRLTFDLGGKTVTATIGDDLKIALFDDEVGKPVKSLPKRGADPDRYEEEKARLSQMRKDIRKVVSQRRKLLLGDFLSGRGRDAKGWRKSYLGNPVLRSIARLLVWDQGGSTFTVLDGATVDASGAEVALGSGEVKVAHPIEMDPADVEAWRAYFASRCLKQPFEQVWERRIDLSEVKADRYKGYMIKAYRFMRRDDEGIHLSNGDYNSFGYELRLDHAKIEYSMPNPSWHGDAQDEIEITSFKPHAYRPRGANHLVCYLDKCCLYPRIAANDLTVMGDLSNPTLAQVIEYSDVAAENGAVELAALLVDYRREHFPEYASVDSLLLD